MNRENKRKQYEKGYYSATVAVDASGTVMAGASGSEVTVASSA